MCKNYPALKIGGGYTDRQHKQEGYWKESIGIFAKNKTALLQMQQLQVDFFARTN